MNWNFRKLSSVVVVLILIGAFLQWFARDAAARSNREDTLQGTWRVQLNPRNCQTGAPIPPFSLVLSFAQGGTLTEIMNSPALLPGQRTPGLGVWSHTQGNAYKGVWDAFILFDSPVFKRGVQRLMWDFEVDGDQLTISATSQFLDPNGSPFIPPINTCASGTGTRFEDAQDED